MKKISWILFLPLGLLIRLYAYLHGQRMIKRQKIKGPAITLSNHTSFYDFIYTFNAIYPRRMHFLAAMKMFYEPYLRHILRWAKAIPKALLQTDSVATLKTLKVLKKGGIISIFPEGQISMTGDYMPQNIALAKLIKKANCDVYFITHQNAYQTNPPWSKSHFKGKIYTHVSRYDKMAIQTDSIEKVHQHIIDQLSKYRPIEAKKKAIKLNDINGLEHMIYQCPSCKHEGLVCKKHSLVCPTCNQRYEYDRYGYLNSKPISFYTTFQQEQLALAYQKDIHFSLSSPCDLQMIKDCLVQVVGSGSITLNEDEYIYIGIIDNEAIRLSFLTKDIPSLPSDIGKNIQIYSNYQLYQFVLKEKHMPTKFVLLGEYFHKIKQNSI